MSSGAPNAGRAYTHRVHKRESGATLLELLATTYPNASRSDWLARIRNGQVDIDGELADAHAVLSSGARVVYRRTPWVEPAAPLSELKTLHDDGQLVVLCKPSGLPVLPSELYWDHTVLNVLLRRSRAADSSSEAPHPCHRLGVGTSGLLLCAVGAAPRAALSRAFEAREVSKTYRALASGIITAPHPALQQRQRKRDRCCAGVEEPMEPELLVETDSAAAEAAEAAEVAEAAEAAEAAQQHGATEGADEDGDAPADEPSFEVECPIGPVPHSSWAGSVHGAMPDGGVGAKVARSVVRVLRRDVAAHQTLVEVLIPTGRPHQIRIHMAYLGHPLVGDPLFVAGGRPRPPLPPDDDDDDEAAAAPAAAEEAARGASAAGAERPRPPLPRDGGYLLHAWRAAFAHPATRERVSFCAPPPPALCTQAELLKRSC